MMCLTEIHQKATGGGPARCQIHGAAVRVIDKRTGKLLFDRDEAGLSQFYALHADLRAGKIDFISQNLKLTLSYGDATVSATGGGARQATNTDSAYRGYGGEPAPAVRQV